MSAPYRSSRPDGLAEESKTRELGTLARAFGGVQVAVLVLVGLVALAVGLTLVFAA